MCGICGIYNLDGRPVSAEMLLEMRDSLIHRGPDGAGFALFSSTGTAAPVISRRADVAVNTVGGLDLGLAARRLAIIDLVTGDQPISNEDGTVWVVQNGEIYNYRELRLELEHLGHRFSTQSDTEVIVQAYDAFGENCPRRLNGIFAFAIWDLRRRSLFLARDHFGVKPLYYTRIGNKFLFGSEIKSILADPAVPREVDLDALNLCLTLRHVPSPWTLFRGIRKLPPGCSLTVSREGLRERAFFSDAEVPDRRPSEEEWIREVQAGFDKAVERQMVSDVPIGLSLSGGVDSTAVLALMAKYSSGPVTAFTVGFSGDERHDETSLAEESARRFGADFHSRVVTENDYAQFLPRYIWHLEEPVGNNSAAAFYFVVEMAHTAGVKVLLTGQGADEPFGGYDRYFATAYRKWLRLATLPPWRWLAPITLGGRRIGEQYERLVFAAGARSEEEAFLRTYSILTDGHKQRLIGADAYQHMDPDLPERYVREWLARAPPGTALERMTWLDARTSLPDNLLLVGDKMSMASSVEARVPFLDLELMRIAERIPGRFKVRRRRDKYLERKALLQLVGPEVSARTKIGFESAVDVWLRRQLSDQLIDATAQEDSFVTTYLQRDAVSRLVREHISGRRDHQRILFLLLSLESWYSVFFRDRSAVPS